MNEHDIASAKNAENQTLLSESYRRFARAIGSFSDFNGFCDSLRQAVESDPIFCGSFLVSDANPDSSPEVLGEVFEPGRVVMPMAGRAKGGFFAISERRDQRPFGPEDLDLMGSMADFLAALYAQSKRQQHELEKARVLQFLIDQLPIGVLCFSSSGDFLSGNVLGWKQLGLEAEPQDPSACEVLLLLQEGLGQSPEAHIEVQGRLLYAARRDFKAGADTFSACVLYDLSNRREKLLNTMEREFYKGRVVDQAVSVVLVESRTKPGAVYGALKAGLDLEPEYVQPLDAYCCACVFAGVTKGVAGDMLRGPSAALAESKVTVFELQVDPPNFDLMELLARGQESLQRRDEFFMPQVLVVDAYKPVSETVAVILEGSSKVSYLATPEAAVSALERGEVPDCILLDVDSFSPESLSSLRACDPVASSKVAILYTSCRAKSMLPETLELGARDLCLQKPFDSSSLLRAFLLRLNLT